MNSLHLIYLYYKSLLSHFGIYCLFFQPTSVVLSLTVYLHAVHWLNYFYTFFKMDYKLFFNFLLQIIIFLTNISVLQPDYEDKDDSHFDFPSAKNSSNHSNHNHSRNGSIYGEFKQPFTYASKIVLFYDLRSV